MKKIIIALCMLFLFTGCSRSEESTFVIKNKKDRYELYTTEGKKLSKYAFDDYTTIEDSGYVVQKDKKFAYLDTNGKELIALGKYKRLKVLEEMVIAVDDKEKLTVYDANGKKLYQEDDDTTIKLNSLPVITKGKKTTVLNHRGEEVLTTKEKVVSTGFKDNAFFVSYDDRTVFKDYTIDKQEDIEIPVTGKYKLMGVDIKAGYLLYDKEAKNLTYVSYDGLNYYTIEIVLDDVTFDEGHNIIGMKGDRRILINPIGKMIATNNSYYYNFNYYVEKNKTMPYGPHKFVKEDSEKEVSGIQLNPISNYTYRKLFPVYIRDKGYGYYNFGGKQVIDKVFDEAGVFDKNGRAIVREDDKVYLIDTKGNKMTNHYLKIEALDEGYYAAYEESDKYLIIDKDGTDVLPDFYMGKKEIARDFDKLYGIFNRSGRTYVYDLLEMEELFNHEGELIYDEQGCLVDEDGNYYTMNGTCFYKQK